MKYASRSALGAIVGCSVLMLSGLAAAQDASEGDLPPEELPPEKLAPEEGGTDRGSSSEGRSLIGHLFMPSELLVDPFAATYFRATTSAGHATSTGPAYNRLGAFLFGDGEREYSQAALAPAFELQVAPLAWLALRIGGSAVVYSGIDTPTVLGLGANVDIRGRAGATLTLPKAKWVRPAVVFDVEHGPAYDVDPLATIRASIDAGELVSRSALDTGTVTTLTPGLSAAMAFHRAFGVVLNALYIGRTGDEIGASLSSDAFSLGVALDLDLKAITFLPLGVMGAFTWLDGWDSEDDSNQEGSLGLFYTARQDLVLGLIGGVRNFVQLQQAERFDSTVVLAKVTMRYYW